MHVYISNSTGCVVQEVTDVNAPIYPDCGIVELPAALEQAFRAGVGFHYPDWTPLPRPGRNKRLIEERWKRVRVYRTALLTATDFTQLPDVALDHAAWAVYRQALRDVTNQPDPTAITWPTPPDASIIKNVPPMEVLL